MSKHKREYYLVRSRARQMEDILGDLVESYDEGSLILSDEVVGAQREYLIGVFEEAAEVLVLDDEIAEEEDD